MPVKKRSMKVVLKRPASAITCSDDEPLVGAEVDAPTEPALKVKMPPALVAWKTGNAEWGAAQSQGVGDYIKALQKKGYTGAADTLKDAKKKQDKQEVLSKLYLCKDTASMKVFEKRHISDGTKNKMTAGLMTCFEIWDLKKIPVNSETLKIRQEVLSKLETVEDAESPDGFLYKYCHRHLVQRSIVSKKDTELLARGTLTDAGEWDDAAALMAEDAQKNIDKMGGGSGSSVPQLVDGEVVRPAAKSKSKAQAKAKPKAKAHLKIEELELNDEEKEIAQLVINKSVWVKNMQNAVTRCNKEIDAVSLTEAKIKNNQKKLGAMHISNWRASRLAIVTLKESANVSIICADTIDPKVFGTQEKDKQLAIAKTTLAMYLKHKAAIDSCIANA